ncbi:LysR substrate-binding domain-containing protein [Micrococcus terreus]|uniref:LysR substrate-binding domain-containing protein n=1 Tax=Micrococcus terreus TaxID=574650 RepID=UPI00255004C1|nr:LysR substrate-binding domain-containing protein [Micrococcus terreus]MDK7700020.1 LysR substrate-binding domain-containing protein [Micrococcus terreus]WOO97111.1 LysR substrate-binding domain-containing protein [Micrococcus terreus]
MRFTLVQLTYFTEAAREGSLTLAAKRLHVSQSALSAAVAQLEQTMGTALFERVPRRGVRLTKAGRKLYDDAVRLLDRARQMEEGMVRSAASVGGVLRVGMYQPMAPFRAPQVLGAFSRRLPQVTVELMEADQVELARLLSAQEVDVAVSYSMIPFAGMRTELIEEIAPHLVVPVTHRLASREGGVSLREVAEDPLILLDLPHAGSYYLGLYKALGLEPTVRFRLTGYETVRGMVAHGYGVSVLHQRMSPRETYDGEPVRVLELSDRLPRMPVHLVRRPGQEPTALVEAFAEVCREQFGQRQARLADGVHPKTAEEKASNESM